MRPLRFAALLLLAHALPAQQSQWVHPGPDGRLVYRHDTTGAVIPDFSFAGYRSGGVALPTVPARIRLIPSGADDTAAIQHAIDTVSARPLSAKGFRGAIELAPGVFQCSAALTIAASGVVLRGAGSTAQHASTIELTGAPHTDILVKGSFALKPLAPATDITDTYIPFGAHTIHVADASHIHPGDLVQISKPVTLAWIQFMGMSELERADRDEHWINGALTVRRRVTAVSGHAITFQIALMDSYDSQFLGPEHFTAQPVAVSGQVQEVGIEDLRIAAPAVSVGFHDAHTIAMQIAAAADSWVRNIATNDTTEGIRMDIDSERITLTRIDVQQSKTVTSSAKPSTSPSTAPRFSSTAPPAPATASSTSRPNPASKARSSFSTPSSTATATSNLTNAGPPACSSTTAPSPRAAFTSSTAASRAPATAGPSAGASSGTAPPPTSSSSRPPEPSPGPWAIAARSRPRACPTAKAVASTALNSPQASSNRRAIPSLLKASTSPSSPSASAPTP